MTEGEVFHALTLPFRELGSFRNGVNFSKESRGNKVKLINVKDIFGDSPRIDFPSLDQVEIGAIRDLNPYQAEENDLFFVRSSVKRDGVGLVRLADASSRGAVHCGFVIRFRPAAKLVDPRYLTYLLRSPEYREKIKNLSGGAAITNISQDNLGQLPVVLPDFATQRRTAFILSAYDDLIENNTRRIAILEEMARRIYEEWFVRFRSPGHKQVQMVESELGLIPEGWKVVAASDAITINPKVRVPKEGQKPFVPMGSLSENSMLISDIGEREGNSGSKFQNGDTLFARITPCLENGKTGFVQFLPNEDAVAFGSTEFIVLRSRSLCPEYVYALARSDEFRGNAIKSMSGATGRQRVKEACFDSFLLAQPDAETLKRYREIVQPMFAMIRKLAAKNVNLRATRDLLLPKLISGELDVSTLPEPEEAIAA